MKHSHRRALDEPPEAVLARLHDLDALAARLPGEVEVGPDEITCSLRAPRDLRVRLAVERLPDGLSWVLVEGTAATLTGRLRVEAGALVCEQEIDLGVPLPGPLWRELDEVVLPAWLAAI